MLSPLSSKTLQFHALTEILLPVVVILFIVVIVHHLHVGHGQGHHLPQGQAVGKDVRLVCDLPSFLQGLLGLPGLRADVVRVGVRHWKGGEGQGDGCLAEHLHLG